jgi:outer membrane protein OmpA-like peptidoglycan-associated protein
MCRTIWLAVPLLLALMGCKPEAARPVEGPPAASYYKELGEAIRFVAEKLVAQVPETQVAQLKNVPVDQFFNEHSAEVAGESKNLQRQLVGVLSSVLPDVGFAPLTTKNVQTAQWVVLPSFAAVKAEDAGRPGRWVRLQVALADVKTGSSLARVTTFLDASQFNAAPSKFYKDAPMFLTDSAHRERNAVIAGKAAPLGSTLKLRAELIEAADYYDDGRYAEAEERFARAIAMAPQHTGALSGYYQALWRQGKRTDAEKAFARLVGAGIDGGALAVKLLFKVNSTDFIDEAELGQQYPIWLKAIAQQVAERKICSTVSGHASVSGSPEYNDKLSLQRAQRIVDRMRQAVPTAAPRLKPLGKGTRETLVGTGANDFSDAVDRRVEFSVHSCD